MNHMYWRRTPLSRGCALVFALIATSALGCEDVSWPEPQYVASLRVLGVTANPPTLSPNAATDLSLFCADGRGGPKSDPDCQVEVAWFSQCDNPPKNDPKKCFDRYRPWGHSLSPNVIATPVGEWPEGFALGRTMRFRSPENILANELEVNGQTLRYGDSYIYFAACAGRLVTDPDVVERLPVACEDPNSGERLGQDRFVVGFTTLYSYEGITSRNPELVDARITDGQFDAASLSVACSATGECLEGFACSESGLCLPSVPPCNKDVPGSCEWHCLTFGVTPESFWLYRADGVVLASPTKSLWLEYFTNAGVIADDNGFALRPPTGTVADNITPCIPWRAPPMATDQAHVWIVVRDDRGGMATWNQRFIVR